MLSKIILFFCSFSVVNLISSSEIEEREMVIVIPSYNNEQWCDRNLYSALTQDYKKFRIIYINDCSSDQTADRVEDIARSRKIDSFRAISFDDSFSKDITEIVAKFSKEVNSESVFFTLLNNTYRCGALENLYRAIYSCQDRDIVITLDGDDWFSDDQVLTRINKAYASGEVWMTHGKFIEYPHGSTLWSEPVPYEIIERNEVRTFKCPSHLRTFYAWIFKKIALEDLLYQGKFFQMTWDMAIMYPILEMAAERHSFLSEINYVYNMMNPINDGKVNAELQRELDRYIRNMKPYQRLEKAG